MTSPEEIEFERFYSYGFKGKEMIAVRAPANTSDGAADLIGRFVRIGAQFYEIMAVSRQISGPIAKGEPIGLEVRAISEGASP